MQVIDAAALNTLSAKLPKLPFNPKWANGTGYFDGAVRELVDQPMASEDHLGRKLIFVPCHIHSVRLTVVLFQRYLDHDRVCIHAPAEFSDAKTQDSEFANLLQKMLLTRPKGWGGWTLSVNGQYLTDPNGQSDRFNTMLSQILQQLK